MKNCILAILLLLTLSATVVAQNPSVAPAASFEQFRKVGENRLWNFEVDKINIGSLSSTVTGKTKIDGIPGYVISQQLALDFRKAGTELTMQSDGEQYVSDRGYYLGCKLELNINGQTSTLRIERDGERLEATVKATGGSTESAEVFPQDGFGFETFYVDLIELYFAMHGAEVEQTYADTFYSVQSMLPVNFSAFCLDYKYQGLFTNRYDSVFVINVTLPENYRLYLNKAFHLAKVEMPDRKLKVYQDFVGPARLTQRRQESGFSFAGLLQSLPVVPVYLAMAALVLVILAWKGWKSRTSYMALVGGMVAFALMPITLHPLQKLVVDSVVIPGAQRGESLYVLAMLPAVLSGLIVTALFAAGMEGLKRTQTIAAPRLAILGAFLGAGFAIAESVFLATTVPSKFLFSMMLVERAAFIVLYASAGALLGRAFEKDTHAQIQAAIASVILITLFKYLPVMVQQRLVELQLMYIFALLLAVITLGVVLIILARSRAKVRPVKQPSRAGQPH